MPATPSPPLRGVWAAALTPFHADLTLDHARLVRHVRRLLDRGCDGVVLFGTTGEAASCSVDERRAALAAVAEAGVSMHRVVVGTGCCAVPDTAVLTADAADAGAAAVLMLPPFYYPAPSEEGVAAAFDAVLQRVGDARLRVLLYHIPQVSGVPFTHALVERLRAAHPKAVAGIKDSTGDRAHTLALRRAFPDLAVFAGTEALLLDVVRARGAGCISATANLTSPLAAEVYARRDEPAADALQARLTARRTALTATPPIATLKALLARRTGEPDWAVVRPPLTPLSAADADAAEARLAAV